MKKEDAVQLLLDGKLSRIGVKRAVFTDLQNQEPVKMGSFDLVDQDHDARLEDGQLYMDMWFNESRIQDPFKNAMVNTQEVETPDGTVVTLHKYRMIVELDYILLDGNRIWLD